MNELIQIRQTTNGRQSVSARELYEFLGFDASNWSRWYQQNIVNNQFAREGEDWEPLVIMTSCGNKEVTATPQTPNPARDFLVTLDFAKRLSMMARTDRARFCRRPAPSS